MNKENITRILLEFILVLSCTIVAILSYNQGHLLSGSIWVIVSVSWAVDLGYSLKIVKQEKYVDFLQFMMLNYLCIKDKKEGELNAKSKQVDESKKHKGK